MKQHPTEGRRVGISAKGAHGAASRVSQAPGRLEARHVDIAVSFCCNDHLSDRFWSLIFAIMDVLVIESNGTCPLAGDGIMHARLY